MTLYDERIQLVKKLLMNHTVESYDDLARVIVDSLNKASVEEHSHNSRFKITFDDETEPENIEAKNEITYS